MTRITQATLGLCVLSLAMGSAMAASTTGSELSVVLTPSYEKSLQDVGSAVNFTMRNDSKKAVKVLKWQTPFYGLQHNLFEVSVGGQEVEYEGAWYKRGEPTKDDWMVLQPGEAKSIDVDLSVVYPFEASGQYEMRYSAFVNRFVVTPKPERQVK